MSSIGTGYDLSASTFSPDGRVFQVEYAMKAVENSSTAIAIRCKDGVVFGVEKLVLSKLGERGSLQLQIELRTRHSPQAPVRESGHVRARLHVQRCEAVRLQLHPGSYDKDDGPQLYMVDPSGISHGYWGCAIGKAKQAAKTEIEKLQMKDMTCREVVKEVAKIIYIVHDEVKDKAFELELSWVGEVTDGRHQLVPKDVREEAEKYAKDSLEEEDDSDEDNM
ncbi:hypothetical protein F7725_008808 [Dissostichus mawsoni]|uniref:Proteasome subunit alpha type n=1 Tax=Dissostichus mawsoni TaxID=36200 RepID=A0A7J5Y8C8_DISMA|nr:hypothetical protein F7725_008808 [Dissostichus mawsoni]